MKIAVECNSPLLQKSLELFLSKYLSSIKRCDIVVRDKEVRDDAKNFFISSQKGADLIKPFSKSQLILALEKRYRELYPNASLKQNRAEHYESQSDALDFSILEKRIETLTTEYKENILRAVRAFYEK